jgi:thiol-disulfide isomerase/thioredoxin
MIARIGLIFSALLVIGAGWAFQQWLAAPRPEAPPIALPATALVDLDGKPQRLDAWPGKVLLVNFWASWCEPCREEIPALNRLQQQYGAQGLQVLGIAIDEPDAVRQFQAQVPMAYPVLLAPDQGIRLMEQWGNRFGVLPYSVVFDRQGQLRQRHPGAISAQEAEAAVRPWLDSGSAQPDGAGQKPASPD